MSFDATTGRYAVRLERDGASIMVKPENLARASDVAIDAETGEAETEETRVVVEELELDEEEDGGEAEARAREAARPSAAEAEALYSRLWAEREAGRDEARIVDVTD